jgi:hypothetical protein
MIVGRRPVGERPEAAQQNQLLLAKARDVGEGLGSSQHREQAQEQYLVERINHFAGLPPIRHILEILEKNRCLGERRKIPYRLVHRPILRLESEDDDRFSSNPICHALLHPIALMRAALTVVTIVVM